MPLPGNGLKKILTEEKKSPVVQTNPVTGWKALYGLGYQVQFGGINDVTDYESQLIQAYCE